MVNIKTKPDLFLNTICKVHKILLPFLKYSYEYMQFHFFKLFLLSLTHSSEDDLHVKILCWHPWTMVILN